MSLLFKHINILILVYILGVFEATLFNLHLDLGYIFNNKGTRVGASQSWDKKV